MYKDVHENTDTHKWQHIETKKTKESMKYNLTIVKVIIEEKRETSPDVSDFISYIERKLLLFYNSKFLQNGLYTLIILIIKMEILYSLVKNNVNFSYQWIDDTNGKKEHKVCKDSPMKIRLYLERYQKVTPGYFPLYRARNIEF